MRRVQTFRNRVSHCFPKDMPSVVRDCIRHWPAIRLWAPAYLAEACGHIAVTVALYDPDEQLTFLEQTAADVHKQVRLQDFLTTLESSAMLYALRENRSLLQEFPKLLNGFDHVAPFCSGITDIRGRYVALWIGPAKYVTGLHTDPGHTMLFQLYGRKEVLLFSPWQTPYLYEEDRDHVRSEFERGALRQRLNESELRTLEQRVRWGKVNPFGPDLRRFPRFRLAEGFHTTLSAGDMLFIPDGWWHAVRSLDSVISLSVEPKF